MTSSGYILYDKPAGVTSFTALRGMRTSFGAAKVGHAGTLDSFATGLLFVVVGSYSRLVPWLVGLDKVYEAEFEFGTATDTLDPLGIIVGTSAIPDASSLNSAMPTLLGTQMQIPPDYSAIHVAGKRASDLARKGIVPGLEARQITIYSLDLLEFAGKTCKVRIHCSSGTYVRAIARDLAAACGAVAHVKNLRRISIGPFSLDGSASDSTEDFHAALRMFKPEDAKSIGLEVATLQKESETTFLHGAPFMLERLLGKLQGEKKQDIAVFVADSRFLGVVGLRDSSPHYLMVVPLQGGEQ
jgi:tRNA pseudouridine55 synthase